jgi:hypothetical protein
MLTWASNKFSHYFGSHSNIPAADVHKDIFGRVVERGDDFFHPKKFRGIPVFDVDSIYRHYRPQMEKIRTHFDIGEQRRTPSGESLYKVLVEDIVKRYIEFCHMIPASEDHHHSTTGGLLLHSLEASVESLRWAKEKDPRITGFVDIDAKVKPVMIYCAWLAALLHDAGKMMRDISVDAVEVLDARNRLIKPHVTIVSWHPARESLIEWAKQHRVASYSVNFLQGRVHRRHNIDSSQILQPILRGQYAMEYLLSTPINQQVYNDITRVLSGYTTSDDFLSESVRMGDAASTSRSLGYFYDTRLGSRAISTAQRLFKTIQAAATEWEWNRADGKGWIIGNDVYIRWTSSIDNILKVSIELGYSLPTDVKNILNIMDSNLITDLFDRSFPDDRIIRFCHGKFDEDALRNIKDGKQVVVWHDLLKLRGPQIIFSESPMPYSQPGIVYLPQSNRYYLINKDGEIVTTLSAVNQIATKPDVNKSNQPDSETLQTTQANSADASANTASDTLMTKPPAKKPKGKPKTSKPDVNSALPGKAKQNKGLNGISFKNINTTDDPTESARNETPAQAIGEAKANKTGPTAPLNKSSSAKLSDILKTALNNDVRTFNDQGHILLSIEDLETHTGLSGRTIISNLDKASELHLDMTRPNRKTWMHVGDDELKIKCVKLAKSCSSHFDNAPRELEHSEIPTAKSITEQSNLSSNDDDLSTSSNVDEHDQAEINPLSLDAAQPDFFDTPDDSNLPLSSEHADLVHALDKDTLLHFLKNQNELHIITSDDKGHCLFNHHALSPESRKVISFYKLKNLLVSRGFQKTSTGYRLPINKLRNIQLSEVLPNG